MKKEWKILLIGNSFSQDASRMLAQVGLEMGAEKVRVVNLFVPGCSVRMHWKHALKDMPAYRFDEMRGSRLLVTPNYRISEALAADAWDWVCIQQGSSDGSFYSREESYDCLPNLLTYIRQRVPATTRIAFNMTWVGEPEHKHREMVFYKGDQKKLMGQIAELTKSLVAPMEGIDRICPLGTAIQHMRAEGVGVLTRDGYHLNTGMGRYTAALTLWMTLTDTDVRNILWHPDSVNESLRDICSSCAHRAVMNPYTLP